MLRSFLKSSIRNILRQRGYVFLNISGLAIGVASSLVILLWVLDEVSCDKFHEQGESIYKVYRQIDRNGERIFDGSSSAPVGPAILNHEPGVSTFSRAMDSYTTLEFETRTASDAGYYVDENFLSLFSFPLIQGDTGTALAAPNSIILTQETALKLFGDDNPMGKQLNNGLVVTGVAENAPANSSLEFSYLIPFAWAEQQGIVDSEQWYHFMMDLYLVIQNPSDVDAIDLGIRNLFRGLDTQSTLELYLLPLADVHLHGLDNGGRIVYIYIFGAVAVLLLAVACINFVNIATARSTTRAREIGTRKAIGASRGHLVGQILVESIMQTTAGVILATAMVELSLPMLTAFFGKALIFEVTGSVVLSLVILAVVLGIAAGSYPAFVISSFKAAASLKATSTGTNRKRFGTVQKALVIFQFAASSVLIFGALVIYYQMDLIQTADLGLDTEDVIVIRTRGLDQDHETFRQELTQSPGVLGVTLAMNPPVRCTWTMSDFDFEDRLDQEVIRSNVAWVDHDYIEMFGLDVIEGRRFSQDYPSDATEGVIINETAARIMHMQSPVGKTINFDEIDRPIIGIVKDFHYVSLHEAVMPLIIGINPEYYSNLCVKISSDNQATTLASIEKTWKKFRPNDEYSYQFLTDMLGRAYRIEQRTKSLVLAFTIITSIVASLGLLGLAASSAERRTKEIGIRKVLGSSTSAIVGLLTKEFLTLVVIGNLIAIPIASYVSNQWLQSFVYRIDLGVGLFVGTGCVAVVLASLTVSFQAIKAARANPIKALKYE